ncbi:SGNH/GDSL hydrolase family protein [Petrotoga sp. 9PWA.NaAc.5.4]|uniref:SGNH/GDSL hydrolase family protein n=1 Tax=Petrotoga sp. 9PWA.NaAc.5.4 TaxID=1434328 RepID=UPI000CBE3369|nr:SGNH/GDSL hydrolase family protein [Petrotoga sp. 9PWA.NaAc.5.4]PNR94312.1 hypothetical protein X924_06800 [Petrotoga sp. 9PWA.NaAc.5.4]
MNSWVSCWSYVPLRIELPKHYQNLEEQMLLIKNNVNGQKIRVTLTNKYDSEEIEFEEIFIGNVYSNSILVKEQGIDSLKLNFKGNKSFLLKPGEKIISDEMDFFTECNEYIRLESRFKRKNRSSVSTGNFFIKDQDITLVSNIKDDLENLYVQKVIKVEIETKEEIKTIVAFGDSITNDSKWTAPLTERLYKEYPGKITLVNSGIYGNRLLNDSESGYFFGEAGLKRFEKDIFEEHNNVGLVVILEGINDIIHPLSGTAPVSEKVDAEKIIEALKLLIYKAHKNDSRILLGTITPFYNYNSVWNENEEKKRQKINKWIRNNNYSDGFIDFDMILRDPTEPRKLYYEYDSGDNLHLSIKGGKKVSESIDTKKLYELCTK